MPDLHPFPALRFSRHAGSLSELLAPPYDVITMVDAERLRSRHRANAVRLVLPEGYGPEKYEGAATLLEEWREAGLLELDPAPSVTVYRQDFVGPDGPVSRHGLFAALTLSPPDQGEVLPHERTHSGPKSDRLALTLATRTQLSPVFLTARDESARLFEGLVVATAAEPDRRAVTPDGVSHALWQIDDPHLASSLCDAAGAAPLLIADGHHRYETALEASRELGAGVPAAQRVLSCVVSGRDPGLRIQPTHRTVIGAPIPGSLEDWTAVLSDSFQLRSVADPRPVSAARHAEDQDVIVFWFRGKAWELLPAAGAVLGAGLDGADASVSSVVLDHLVIEGILCQDADTAARDGRLAYYRDAEEAVLAAGGEGAAFLLPAVAQEAVWRVTALGRRLPPKSTYYEPKIPSGLLFRPLDAGN